MWCGIKIQGTRVIVIAFTVFFFYHITQINSFFRQKYFYWTLLPPNLLLYVSNTLQLEYLS